MPPFMKGEPITLRDRALLELLYSSGARVSELIGLNIADIATVDSEDGAITTIKLRGKGAKERIVPLGSLLRKLSKITLFGYVHPLPQKLIKGSSTTSQR